MTDQFAPASMQDLMQGLMRNRLWSAAPGAQVMHCGTADAFMLASIQTDTTREDALSELKTIGVLPFVRRCDAVLMFNGSG